MRIAVIFIALTMISVSLHPGASKAEGAAIQVAEGKKKADKKATAKPDKPKTVCQVEQQSVKRPNGKTVIRSFNVCRQNGTVVSRAMI